MAKKSAASKGYRRQTAKKPYLSKKDIITLCVILAVVAVGAWLLFSYNDGALKVRDGKVAVDGDNWLIVNGSASRGGARYYKVGEIGEIEGYTREAGTLLADANIPLYTFKPQGDDGAVTEITVTTSHNAAGKLAEYASTAIGSTEGCESGGVLKAEAGGQSCTYFVYTSASYEAEKAEGDADTEGEADADAEAEALPDDAVDAHADDGETHDPNRFTKALNIYFDTVHDSCFVIHVNCEAVSADEYPDDDVLLAAASQAVAAIAPVESK